jgi:hypothetical protein
MNEMRRSGASLKTGEHHDVREQVHQQRKLSPTTSGGAYDLARRRTRGVGNAEYLVRDAYLRAVRFVDGFRGDNALGWTLVIGHNTWFTNGGDGARSPTAPLS